MLPLDRKSLRRHPNLSLLASTALLLLSNLFAITQTANAAQEHETYLMRVKPVLQSRCYACHGALKQEAELRLDTVSSMLSGGESSPAIEVGNAAASLLVQRITAHEESMRMPPDGEPLHPSQIDTIKSWLNEGAHHPPDEVPERDPKEHWAFRAPNRPPVPASEPSSSKPSYSINPIDAFLSEQHRDKNLHPQPIAAPQIWLRRVTLDLVGLPPTKMQIDSFAADHSEDARRQIVEQLLTSPQYGERWGRHWMDIWRYSDWWGLGEEVRNSQKHMWHWRDWIVESLNADMGYDQMLQDMLAADELYPSDLNRLRASGFLARQYFKFNRTSWLDETVEHTSKAMLGLTFNCCKCHDHKYDPISQQDYYRLRAVFEPYQIRTEMLPGTIDFQKDGIPRAFDCNLEQETFVHIRGDDRNPDKSLSMNPSVPELLQWEPFQIQPLALPREAYEPAFREYVLESYQNDIQSKVVAAKKSLAAAQSQFEQSQLAEPQTPEKTLASTEQVALVVVIAQKSLRRWELELEAVPLRFAADRAKISEELPEERNRVVALAGQAENKVKLEKADEELSRAELALLKSTTDTKEANTKKVEAAKNAFESATKQNDAPGGSYVSMRGAEKAAESNLETDESRRKPFPNTSSGRRTALAKWIVDRRNPLTARVAINHIWSRHFGRPLVATVFDFGRKGSPPSNQKLLDWLAVELMENQWSMKHIHRLIVASDAYRRTSSNAGADSNIEIDADNQYYWRMNSTRMESQAVRDSLLSLAGELDLTIGGPAIPAADEKSRRRSLYFVHSHNEHNKLLAAFDDANVLDCYRRGDSIVPQQALALENSKLAMEMVERLAQRLQDANPTVSDREFAQIAFVTILADEPTLAELEWIASSMTKMRGLAQEPDSDHATRQARVSLVRGLVNHNDFITIR